MDAINKHLNSKENNLQCYQVNYEILDFDEDAFTDCYEDEVENAEKPLVRRVNGTLISARPMQPIFSESLLEKCYLAQPSRKQGISPLKAALKIFLLM